MNIGERQTPAQNTTFRFSQEEKVQEYLSSDSLETKLTDILCNT